jgi:hypothetical protein
MANLDAVLRSMLERNLAAAAEGENTSYPWTKV